MNSQRYKMATHSGSRVTLGSAGSIDQGEETTSLKNTFDDGMKLLQLVETGSEPTNSPTMQLSVKQAIHKFETATQHVSMLGLFSRNESFEEVTTESLQYLLLPALLGTLTLKLCELPRREVIDLAEIYFKDFLQRCKDYGVTNIEIPTSSNGEQESCVTSRIQTEQQKIASMVLSREAKIKRYKEQKELKDKLVSLKKAMDSPVIDEQKKREYFSTLLLNYVNQSLDELSSIEQEKPILDYMAKHGEECKPKPIQKKTPLKPIIITRDAVQKAVFGLGYPSIPTLTIEEFYDQRVREGTFPGPGTTNIPHTNIQTADNSGEDAQQLHRELLREKDDPEELQRQRNMDEYKDEHRRGEGNRYNRS